LRGEMWLPSLDRRGEGPAQGACRWEAPGGHRGKDGGTESSPSRVNWGPSARPRADGLSMHKPAVARRSADVAIVSDEVGGQNNRWRSQGPLGGCVVSEAVSAARRKPDYGTKTRTAEISTVAAYKWREPRRPLLTARLKPYWGKPAVRNFRGVEETRDDLAAICHDARKGRYIGSR
jgi:hypothetical protein